MTYLVDTDVIIDALHSRRDGVELLERLAPAGLAISVISVGELEEGAHLASDPGTHLATVRQFISGYQILPVTMPIMSQFAELRAGLRRAGLLIADFDLVIAATAIAHDYSLLTRNIRHFGRIPDLRRYSVDTGAQ